MVEVPLVLRFAGFGGVGVESSGAASVGAERGGALGGGEGGVHGLVGVDVQVEGRVGVLVADLGARGVQALLRDVGPRADGVEGEGDGGFEAHGRRMG